MKNISAWLLCAAVIASSASASTPIDFESNQSYKALGVYDVWEASPFRTGQLEGNVTVTDNPDTSVDEVIGRQLNPSQHVAGAQRSRFGSNRFGLRIDLADDQCFQLTPTTKYVHVKLLTPQEGRVMLIGLGSRNDAPEGDDQFVEQFWALSSNQLTTDAWTDMVFPVKGAGGITVRSLVVVPHCESPHDLAEDFLFYIDDVEITDQPNPYFSHGFYNVAFDRATTTLPRNDRYTTAVGLDGTQLGHQSLATGQRENKLAYVDLTEAFPLAVKAGETVTPFVDYNSTWMHSYCYIDRNNNGTFDKEECVSWSYLNGTDSEGRRVGEDVGVGLPPVTIAHDTKPGVYRIRFKVDWDEASPAGTSEEGNSLADNGGIIADAMLRVYGTEVQVNDHQLNGEVLATDGRRKLDNLMVPSAQSLDVTIAPEVGFRNGGFAVTHGFNLGADRVDRFGNVQWITEQIPLSEFTEGSATYLLPARVFTGSEVLIQGNMVEQR